MFALAQNKTCWFQWLLEQRMLQKPHTSLQCNTFYDTSWVDSSSQSKNQNYAPQTKKKISISWKNFQYYVSRVM